MESITLRDDKKVFKINSLQSNVDGVSCSGLNATVRNVGLGNVIFMGFMLHNNDAATRWLQVFFKQASDVALGTTPPDMTVMVGSGSSIFGSLGDDNSVIRSVEGLSVACTTTETGSTGPTSAMTGSVFYGE